MQTATKTIVAAALAADASVPPRLAHNALKLLDGDDTDAVPLGRVVRTREACERFGVTSKTLRLWALQGMLVPVYGGQTKRRTGYTEASVRAILAGRGVKKAPASSSIIQPAPLTPEEGVAR